MLKTNYKNTAINHYFFNRQDLDRKNLNKMEINWDLIINFAVIGSIILFAISKLTGQTIGELFKGIREFILDTKEDVEENTQNLAYYD